MSGHDQPMETGDSDTGDTGDGTTVHDELDDGPEVGTSGAPTRAGFVALVGEANAGKSTLLNALLGEKVSIVSPKAHTTRTRILGVHTTGEGQIVFVDTPGFVRGKLGGELQKFIHERTVEAVEGVDVTVLVLDAARLAARPSLAEEQRSLLSERGIAAADVVLVNKIDLVDKRALLPLLGELGRVFAEHAERVPEIIPVSALKRDGLDRLERVLFSLLPEGIPLFPEDVLTDQPERVLAGEVVREKLFRQLNQELPYSLAVTVDRFERDGGLLRISATVIVERESQKGIVIGKGGTKLKSVGTAARTELELLFESKVFLELFVRVDEQWTRTRRGLERAGLNAE